MKNAKGTKKVGNGKKKSLVQVAREWIAKQDTKTLGNHTQGELCKLLNSRRGKGKKVGIGQFQQILKKEAESRGFEIFYKNSEA